MDQPAGVCDAQVTSVVQDAQVVQDAESACDA